MAQLNCRKFGTRNWQAAQPHRSLVSDSASALSIVPRYEFLFLNSAQVCPLYLNQHGTSCYRSQPAQLISSEHSIDTMANTQSRQIDINFGRSTAENIFNTRLRHVDLYRLLNEPCLRIVTKLRGSGSHGRFSKI